MIQSPRGMTIMEAYELHRKNMLMVNRRYQRKLVWTVLEKQNLIESILKKYPVPLILLASIEDGKYEILDGMQRLNAFFGFIENQFPVIKNGQETYFNVVDYTFAKVQADKGVFAPKEKEHHDFISQEEVSSFITYPFPVTVFETTSETDINETFRRINANGRHLSAQEVRQAGNTSEFSSLVREIASEIRGDASKDILLLSEMPSISIDSKLSSFGYGVNAEDTFWCKHGVLRISDLRESEDEQFIADIILSISLEKPFPASKKEFDNYYGSGENDKSNEIEVKIKAIGKENISRDIKIVFSEIFNFCENYLQGARLKNILNPKAGSNPVKEAFYTLFMAFYELIIKQNKEPFDNLNIKSAIEGLHSKLSSSRNYTTIADRIKNINQTEGLLKNYFKLSSSSFRSSTSHVIDFRTHLSKSKVESAEYDYKQGLYTLDPKGRKMEESMFENKIIRSISALSNLGKGRKGYLIIGVSDKEEDTAKIEKLDNLINVPREYGFGVVGLEREAKLSNITLDEYIANFVRKIQGSALPETIKASVTKSITPITYCDKTILMIEVNCGIEPIYYKDKMYVREGANNIEVTGAKQASIFKLFS